MEYQELLRHPFWQKKRLSVLTRDNFKCTKCSNEFENLQIHHLFYQPDTMPWEYDDSALVTVCELCHEKLEFIKWLLKIAPSVLKHDNFEREDIKEIIEVINRRLLNNHHKESAQRYMRSIKTLLNNA